MMEVDDYKNFERLTYVHEDLNERFIINEKRFDSQYYPYYNARLKLMSNAIKENARTKWGNDIEFNEMADLAGKSDKKVYIIGTIFKRMHLQPTILKEISTEKDLLPQPIMKKYIDNEDCIFLQDDRDSIQLIGNINVNEFVTGVTLAVQGTTYDDGDKIEVEDYCFMKLNVQSIERPLCGDEDKYVCLISGLGFSKQTTVNILSARNMFVDFITGASFGPSNVEKASKIVKVIIAGNSISIDARKAENADPKTHQQWNQRKARPYTVEIIQKIDSFISDLGRSIDVDLMPGETDISSVILPQQPMHPNLLPKSSYLTSIRSVTNPYSSKIDGRLFLGTSGQNIKNITQYSSLDEPLDILEKTLFWGHLFPTAPDSLSSYPFPDNDPFIIKSTPHIYFAGNQSSFNTKLLNLVDGQTIRLITIPEFETSYNCVLVNLRNLDCELIAFG